jgi:hypothetical protein
MTKKENDVLARDLVLAAFIVLKRQYESRDAGRAGKLQMFLNIHAGLHGDVKNIVAILNNPKSTAKLSEDQRLIYQRALDIVDSVSEAEPGWVAQVDTKPATLFKSEVIDPFITVASSGFDPDTKEEWDDEDPFNSIKATTTTEPVKAKPGRKARNPIEMATANAKSNPKQCC